MRDISTSHAVRHGARTTAFLLALLVLVLLPACGIFTEGCSRERYSWSLFSGGPLDQPHARFAIVEDGHERTFSAASNWLVANATYSDEALRRLCTAHPGADQVIRYRGDDEVDRVTCP